MLTEFVLINEFLVLAVGMNSKNRVCAYYKHLICVDIRFEFEIGS